MNSDKSEVDAIDFQTLHQLAAEVHTRSWRCDSTLVLGKDGLKIICIVISRFTTVNDIVWNRCRSQGVKLTFKLVVRTVIEETQGTTTTGGIVNHLSHHRAILLKEQLVADTNLSCGFYQHIPQAQLLIKFAQQEYLNLGICLLLSTIEASGEHLRIIQQHCVTLAEVVDDVAELNKLVGGITFIVLLEHVDGLALTVHHHHAAFITMIHFLDCTILVLKHLMRRFQGNQFLRQLKFKL